ncbi:MAG: response regulator transcription factor [Anaerolineaceae bacterium]|nr:response regulator transcription factor [Anaerolineaceae bacterium]MCB9099233.1 response regulator transcription factor [Anaerolineales bacterium]
MRVILADDKSQVRDALHILLDQELDMLVVGEASDAESLMAQTQTSLPDLVLVDWELPGFSQTDSLSSLKVTCPNLQVIALSDWPGGQRQALSAGADAFVSKVDSPDRLLDALHAMDTKIRNIIS